MHYFSAHIFAHKETQTHARAHTHTPHSVSLFLSLSLSLSHTHTHAHAHTHTQTRRHADRPGSYTSWSRHPPRLCECLSHICFSYMFILVTFLYILFSVIFFDIPQASACWLILRFTHTNTECQLLTNISVFWKRVPFGFRLWTMFLANSVPRLILLFSRSVQKSPNRIESEVRGGHVSRNMLYLV